MKIFEGIRKRSSSVKIAKNRLQILLTTDRTNCTPDNIENMRSDILNMVSRYMNINPDETEICMRQQIIDNNHMRPVLSIQIPIEHIK